MGNNSNINMPGFLKVWYFNDLVETPYSKISQIPVITLSKQQSRIKQTNADVVILHYNDSSVANEYLQKLKNTKIFNNLQIYSVPNQNSKQNFQTIRKNNPTSLGKMSINGESAHPLFKYLKKRCDKIYSYTTNSAIKKINQDLGIFILRKGKPGMQDEVEYFGKTQLDLHLEKQMRK